MHFYNRRYHELDNIVLVFLILKYKYLKYNENDHPLWEINFVIPFRYLNSSDNLQKSKKQINASPLTQILKFSQVNASKH